MSGSAHDFEDSSLDDIQMDELPRLWDDSERFLEFLIPQDVTPDGVAELRDLLQDGFQGKEMKRPPRSQQSKKFFAHFDSHRRRLQLQLELCNLHESPTIFINIPRALKSLTLDRQSEDLSIKAWRPHPIFHLFNLTKLACDMMLYPLQDGKIFLEELDICFPGAFIEAVLDEEDRYFIEEMFATLVNFGIEIRTQYALAQLHDSISLPNFDHDMVLLQVFYIGKDRLRGWNFEGLRSGEMSKAIQKLVVSRLQEIRSSMKETHNPREALLHLMEKFDWNSFATTLLTWVKSHMSDLYTQVEVVGGAEQLVQMLSNDLARNTETVTTHDGAQGVNARTGTGDGQKQDYVRSSSNVAGDSQGKATRMVSNNTGELSSGVFK